MTDSTPTLTASELLRHAEFVRRLSRRLVHDETAAEDLVQETWMAALQRPPGGQGPRAWLARVLRNRAALTRRGDARREARERTRTDAEPQATPEELVERMELHQLVVAAVLELPSAYREVLILRFYEGESVTGVARRLALEEATVRTRLRRGLERLRDRLQLRFDDRAAFLLALQRLAPPQAGAALVPPTSGATAMVAGLLMKKALLGVSLVLVAVLVGWIASERGREQVRAEPAVPRAAGTQAEARLAPLDPPAPADDPAQPARSGVAPAPPETAAAQPETGAAEERPVVDHSAKAWLHLRVADRYGVPVLGAKASLTGLRTKKYRGDSWSTGEDEDSTGVTDAQGVTKVAYPTFVERHGDWLDVGQLMFTVEHPDYVTFHEQQGVEVDQGEVLVVLQRGAFLILSGWIESPAERILEVVPQLSDEVQVRSEDWLPLRDGRTSCNKVPPGRHAVYVTLQRAGRTFASEVVEFVLEEEEQEELHLQLHAPRSLRGVLDAAVPRPVSNGAVELMLGVGSGWGTPSMMRPFRAPIAADGSFELGGLPPGAGELVGACEGWVSRTVLEPAEDEETAPQRRLQRFDPAAEGSIVLEMERTAVLEVLVLDPRGEPVPGAILWMWPNVHWRNGYSSIFLDRTVVAETDEEGVAVLENLPPGENETLAIQHADYQMPLKASPWGGDARRQEWVQLVSGETARLELRLEAPAEGS